ncbi:MAG: homoserine kinase [Chloroflexota bacterium]|nr:homoserine kinase [Chloroflexota bacterium]NOG64606.1 homoserine kinase [Chloroflexota bacterium]GIK63394.1 MAG: homoserine kinase [Chloroflexota bacterium]
MSQHVPNNGLVPASARAFAPATVANLGPGFDILGMAVTGIGDTVTAHLCDKPGTSVVKITGDGGKLSLDATRNTAAIAAEFVRQQIRPDLGIELEIEKGLPLASGLGSSAASAAAGAVATNALLGNPLSQLELLPACLEAEATVSGRHADNVGPALLGGIVLVTGITPDCLFPLPVPDGLHFALVTPDVAVPTAQARAVLPKEVPFSKMVSQTRAVAELMYGLYSGNLDLLVNAMAEDSIIEPARQHLIPHFAMARDTALAYGAKACIISGAGPTLCIVAPTADLAEKSGAAVQEVFVSHGIGAIYRVAQVATRGAYSF